MNIRLWSGAAVMVVVCSASSASAGYVEIGGGWAARWDDGLDPYVNITGVGLDNDAVYIQKTVDYNGEFVTVPIVFQQISWPAVPNVVIEDEILSNNTGFDWTSFRMQIIDASTSFNVDATMNSGGPGPIGFDIAPFAAGSFDDDDRRLTVSDGLVAAGDVWMPGVGADGGQLWITSSPSPDKPYEQFVLKETPIPGPGAAALLMIAAAGLGRRRRS